jgi:hypothetical protein
MYRPREIYHLIQQAGSGDFPPIGNLEDMDEAFGFSFGSRWNEYGWLAHPGPTNGAIADSIVGNEVLREMNMTLQEELAIAVKEREPRLSDQIIAIPTMKRPGKNYNTDEVLKRALPDLAERNVGSLAVIAYRYHLPRAEAEVRKAGFYTATPDMSEVGDFDPYSAHRQCRSLDDWIRRERLVIPLFAALGHI